MDPKRTPARPPRKPELFNGAEKAKCPAARTLFREKEDEGSKVVPKLAS